VTLYFDKFTGILSDVAPEKASHDDIRAVLGLGNVPITTSSDGKIIIEGVALKVIPKEKISDLKATLTAAV
jgi:hypothetical protein